MVDVPQQKLHGVGIGLRRTVKRCFPLLSGVALFQPVSADGIPRGLELEYDHPQAPRRKDQEQQWDEPCAAHQRQDRNDHTDQSFLNHLVRFLFRCAGFIPAVPPGHRRSVRQRREKPLFHSALDGLISVFAEQVPNRPI